MKKGVKKLTDQQKKTKLRKKCVVLAKIIAKYQAGYKCEKCGVDGKFKQLQGSHIYPEGRYSSMSADIDNILCLCAGCHMWSNDSWHENPLESVEWFHSKFPKRYEELKKRSRESKKCDLIYWQNKWDNLNKIILK
jgi:hypothetical protein